MKSQYRWIAILVLALAVIACQFLLPEDTPTPISRQPGAPTAVETRAAQPTETRPATHAAGATPTSPLPAGLLREPVTDADPAGNNYGWALTGKSGGKKQAEWVEKSVDLSEFASKKILVRFEAITDDTLNYPGVALQDIRIPEINYADSAESGDGGWQAQGFIRTNNYVPEKYSVQLIGVRSNGQVQVERLKVTDDQTGEWDVALSQLKNAVLVISALARTTTEPAPYWLEIK